MKIVVVGTGYVGLSNAILFAQKHEVTAIDIDENKIELINNRKSPILDSYIQEYLSNHNLNLVATTEYEKAYENADFIIISTPTNYDTDKNYFDTSSVEQVIENIVQAKSKATIIIKSTIPVGYTESIVEKYPNQNIFFSPEFLREGKALYDNLYPSRIIIGVPKYELFENSLNKKTDERVLLAEKFLEMAKNLALKEKIQTLVMNSSEAEAVKLFSNTYLAMRVAFFNELDTYAEVKNMNAKSIIKGVCLDPRIGDFYNNPSFGYGGYCLPKDTKQLLANFNSVPNEIMKAIVEANNTRKDFISEIVLRKAEENKQINDLRRKDYKQNADSKPIVGIYRLTMKTMSDNFRQSSIQGIMKRLENQNVEIVIYEPNVSQTHFGMHKVIKNVDEFKKIADVVVANRIDEKIKDIAWKVYSRDIFSRD